MPVFWLIPPEKAPVPGTRASTPECLRRGETTLLFLGTSRELPGTKLTGHRRESCACVHVCDGLLGRPMFAQKEL